jgi:glycosyltransferase involved in cell wall biosynthesis
MLAAQALAETASPPIIVSVWGNDFTLHAPSSPLMRRYTRQALSRLDALLADCRRDLRLAVDWGFDPLKPSAVLPGGGGVQRDLFYPPPEGEIQPPVIINPRGFRAYVRNEAFFHAIPQVLQKHPHARFICPAMSEEAQALRWVAGLNISRNIDLLPRQSRPQMADLFRRSTVAVSPTTHDGTPNTLLEAMACGCFPVAGDLEPLREWITPGENGLLVDPSNPQALAQAVIAALDDPALCARARQANLALVAARADYNKVMASAETFYRDLVKNPPPSPPPRLNP